jgi:hypothetical protein
MKRPNKISRPGVSKLQSEDLPISGGNGRLVRSSLVLKKQDSFRKPKTYQSTYVLKQPQVKKLSPCLTN